VLFRSSYVIGVEGIAFKYCAVLADHVRHAAAARHGAHSEAFGSCRLANRLTDASARANDKNMHHERPRVGLISCDTIEAGLLITNRSELDRSRSRASLTKPSNVPAVA
jgi:hypothetical protein